MMGTVYMETAVAGAHGLLRPAVVSADCTTSSNSSPGPQKHNYLCSGHVPHL